MAQDVTDWKSNMKPHEKNVVGGILKGFAQTETNIPITKHIQGSVKNVNNDVSNVLIINLNSNLLFFKEFKIFLILSLIIKIFYEPFLMI